MFSTALSRFRLVALGEGVSFLVLLGVAMPLKYLSGMPQAVLVVGWIHGILFILYLAALAHVAYVRRWPGREVRLALVASVLPFGPFVFDARLRQDERSAPREGAPGGAEPEGSGTHASP
ncbi:MAG TPA: DUF3817 domain-containing protein [Gemmataceae bacterium]